VAQQQRMNRTRRSLFGHRRTHFPFGFNVPNGNALPGR
jgi:hypothetical protein